MRATRSIALGERNVLLHELTVGEIRVWLLRLETSPGSGLLDVTLFEDISISDLIEMSDLTEADVDGFTPSEIRQVIDAAKELNGDFFGMRGRLARIGKLLAQKASEPSVAI